MLYLFITLVCLVRGQNVDLGNLSPQISSYHVLDYDLSLLEKQQHQTKKSRHRRSVSYRLADSYADHGGIVTLNIVAFNRWVVHSLDRAMERQWNGKNKWFSIGWINTCFLSVFYMMTATVLNGARLVMSNVVNILQIRLKFQVTYPDT